MIKLTDKQAAILGGLLAKAVQRNCWRWHHPRLMRRDGR